MRALLDGFVDVGEVSAEAGYWVNDAGSVWAILKSRQSSPHKYVIIKLSTRAKCGGLGGEVAVEGEDTNSLTVSASNSSTA